MVDEEADLKVRRNSLCMHHRNGQNGCALAQVYQIVSVRFWDAVDKKLYRTTCRVLLVRTLLLLLIANLQRLFSGIGIM